MVLKANAEDYSIAIYYPDNKDGKTITLPNRHPSIKPVFPSSINLEDLLEKLGKGKGEKSVEDQIKEKEKELAELKEIQEKFNKTDKDQNGKLSKQEFSDAIVKEYQETGKLPEGYTNIGDYIADQMKDFDRYDTNKSGDLDSNEFQNLIQKAISWAKLKLAGSDDTDSTPPIQMPHMKIIDFTPREEISNSKLELGLGKDINIPSLKGKNVNNDGKIHAQKAPDKRASNGLNLADAYKIMRYIEAKHDNGSFIDLRKMSPAESQLYSIAARAAGELNPYSHIYDVKDLDTSVADEMIKKFEEENK